MFKSKISFIVLATTLALSACSGELTVDDGKVTAKAGAKKQETAKEFVDKRISLMILNNLMQYRVKNF